MQKPKHTVSGPVNGCQLMKNGIALLTMNKEETHQLTLNLEKSMTTPQEMSRLVQIAWVNVVHLSQ